MAPQHAAALDVGGACKGAALAVNGAVQGLVQALSVDLLVARGRQAVQQACTASGGPVGGSGIAGLFILIMLNLYRARCKIGYLRNSASTLA